MSIYHRLIHKLRRLAEPISNDISYWYYLIWAKFRTLFLGPITKNNPEVLRYLILDVSSAGSLGDEAMITGAINFLAQQGVQHFGVASVHARHDWQGYQGLSTSQIAVEFYSWDMASDRGGTYGKFLQVAQNYSHFVVPGADVMDGYYSESSPLTKLRLISLADAMGLKCSVVGFSFNREPKASCIKAFRRLPATIALHARDPLSQVRFQESTQRQIHLVADLAFLLQPSGGNTIKRVQLWIEQQQQQGNLILGINPNKTLAKLLNSQTPAELSKIFAQLITNLAASAPNISFLLLPHDYRHQELFPGDDGLCQLIYQQLSVELQSKCCYLREGRLMASEIKQLCGNLDLVVTSRMHLAIACLGVTTPVLGIVYQGKFAGLYGYFDLEEMLIEPSAALEEQQLLSWVQQGLNRRQQIKQQIALKLPEVVQMAQQNFASY